MDNKILTDKQKQFCFEYVVDMNATQAAIRAGYSEKTASVIANENLRKPYLLEYLSELIQNKQKTSIATADEVLEYLTRVVRNEEVEEIRARDGDELIDCKTARLTDRTRAAELLAKRYSLLTDKLDIAAQGEFKVVVEYVSADGKPDE